MTTPRLPLLGALAVGALALAGCAGGGGAEPSSPAPSSASSTTTAASSASTSPAASSSTAPTSPAASASTESTASASASSSLSLEMPAALDGQRTLAVQAAVQRAAGPGSEVGLSAVSPLERQTELRQRAAGLEQAVDAGASPASTRSAEQQACLDAARSALERDAEAADLGLTAQPETAATTGGGPTTTPAPSFTASPDAEVTPLGVRVTVYPTEEAARAALEDARAAAQACTGVDLAGLDVESVTRTEHEGGTAYTALPAPGGSVYSHLTAVQDGARTVAVAQADADGGVPADAEDRAASIVADVLAALDGEG